MQPGNEKDFLQYTGNKFPRSLRLAWTLFVVFSVFYLVHYMWPDLVIWISKTK
jgi:hypothetical protein